MSTLNFKEGEYVLIGETVKVHFDYKSGRNSLVIAIDAPDDMPVLRGKLHEQVLAEQAATGDAEAQARHARVKREREKARKSAYISRARRDEQERRMEAGEINRYNE